MKRILEITDSEGNTQFFPQHKVLLWWWFYENYWGRISFPSLEAARKWLNYDPERNVLVHEPAQSAQPLFPWVQEKRPSGR